MAAAILLIASKMLVNLSPWVDQAMASSITTIAAYRPIFICFLSEVKGLIRFTISTATKVAELFNAAASDGYNGGDGAGGDENDAMMAMVVHAGGNDDASGGDGCNYDEDGADVRGCWRCRR